MQYRSAGALGCHPRIRAGFPRDGSITVFFIVARGPVPRDRWIARTIRPTSVVWERLLPIGSGSGDPALQRRGSLVHERWRGTGPRPTVTHAVFYRSAGPVPRDRWLARGIARDRPSPYDEGGVFSRSARALGCHTRIRAGFPRERWRKTPRFLTLTKNLHHIPRKNLHKKTKSGIIEKILRKTPKTLGASRWSRS